MERPSHAPRDRLLLAVACVLLTVVHTWPLALAPHRYSRVDNADYLLNAWAVSWVAHQAVTDPAHLFDANIFWPARGSLGYSEAMIVQSLIAAPVRWLGGSPVAAFNTAALLGFFLTSLAFGLLLYRWTGSLAAAVTAATAAAFNSHIITRSAHLQAMHVEFIAVALYALDGLFTRQRIRDALLLAVAFALQGLTSIYLLTFTTWAMLFGGAARLASAGPDRRGRGLLLAVLAAAIAILLLTPYLLAYYGVHQSQEFARGIGDNRFFAGSYADYLSSVSYVHYWWSRPFFEASRSVNFPGVTVFALAMTALARRATRRDPRVRMCAAIAAGCALVSVAPHVPGYERIHALVPLFWAVRVQAHIGQIVLLSLAVLAGFGVAGLAAAREWRARTWTAVAAGLILLINVEVFRPPGYRQFTGIPAVYDVLAREDRAVVVELPFYTGAAIFRNAWYEFYSTRHWHPIANGYSGFIPRQFGRIAADVRDFPAEHSLQALHRRGFTHAVVHKRTFVEQHGAEAFDAVAASTSLREVAHDDDVYIYRLR